MTSMGHGRFRGRSPLNVSDRMSSFDTSSKTSHMAVYFPRAMNDPSDVRRGCYCGDKHICITLTYPDVGSTFNAFQWRGVYLQ